MKRRRWGCLLVTPLLYFSTADANGPAVFSIPGSALLFGRHNDIRLVTSERIEAIKPPIEIGANEGYFAYPSISPSGDLVAWGFAAQLQRDRPDHQARYTLGVYSLKNLRWKTFGDFDNIGAAAFSPDSSQIAFIEERQNKKELMILEPSSGTMASAPSPKGIPVSATLSWSPDGKRLAVELERGEKNPLVAVLDLNTGDVQSLGEGFNPAWSPTGEWIAYFDPSGAKCLLVHPDGTGSRVIRSVRQSTFSYRRFGWGSPVWSPNGRQVLLDEMKGDGDYSDIILLDVESGRLTTKARNGLPVFGWAHYK